MGWTCRAPAPASRIAGSGLQNQEHSMPHNTSRLEAVATIGIDIGKNAFHLVDLDRNGAIVLRQKLSRRQIEARRWGAPPEPATQGVRSPPASRGPWWVHEDASPLRCG